MYLSLSLLVASNETGPADSGIHAACRTLFVCAACSLTRDMSRHWHSHGMSNIFRKCSMFSYTRHVELLFIEISQPCAFTGLLPSPPILRWQSYGMSNCVCMHDYSANIWHVKPLFCVENFSTLRPHRLRVNEESPLPTLKIK